jgi:uncharacterized protein
VKRHIVVVVVVLLALAGCAGAPQERFYTLGAGGPPPSAPAAAYSVAVGPVTIPALVDRPQMVVNTGANRVMIAEQSRWAEPLRDSIGRAVADHLAQLLRDVRVSAAPQSMARDADYRVLVDVQRFESTPGNSAVLDLRWTIHDAENTTLQAGRSLVREPVGGEGYDALVAAHDRALAAVSRDIAAALRESVFPR